MKNSKLLKSTIVIVIIVLVCATALIFYSAQKKKETAVQETPAATSSASIEPTPVPTSSPTPEQTPAPSSTPEPEQTPEATPAAVESTGCSTNSLASTFTDTNSLLLLANKKNRLPEGYVPNDLVKVNIPCTNGSATMRAEAAASLETMYQAALKDNVSLAISSAFRDESYQSSLYYGYANSYGADYADTISSRPGYSDHQTGLAVDFVEGSSADFNDDFEATASGRWLAANAHLYGFIMRYPPGKAAITGYSYEPWHFRYIGIASATAVYNTSPDESFEEYYQVEGGDYCK